MSFLIELIILCLTLTLLFIGVSKILTTLRTTPVFNEFKNENNLKL